MKRVYLVVILMGISVHSWANDQELDEVINVYNSGDFIRSKEMILKLKNLSDKPKYWYYRGIIFQKLIIEDPLSNNVYRYKQEVIKAYKKVDGNDQLVSYAKYNLNALYEYFMKRGNSYNRIGNYDDALIAFQRASTIYVDDISTLKCVGIISNKLNKRKNSVKIYNKCLSLDKKNVAIACFGAKLFLEQKKYKQAYDIITKTIKEHPYNILMLYVLKSYTEKLHVRNIKKFLNKVLTKDDLEKQYQLAVWAKINENYKGSYNIFHKLYQEYDDDRILIQLCDVSYMYLKELIEEYNELPDEELDNKIDTLALNTISYTESLNKLYPNNLDILNHLYHLYQQANQEEKAEFVKKRLTHIDGGQEILPKIDLKE